MRRIKAERVCPCGKPATLYKYCSVKCRGYYSRLNTRSKPGYKAAFRAYHKKWREKNKDRLRGYVAKIPKERKQAYYQKHRDKRRERAKIYYRKNAEARKEYVRKYIRKNKEKIRQQKAEYRAKHKKELSEKQKARYHAYGKENMKEYRKANAARLKDWQKRYNAAHKEEIAWKQKERLAKMDPEKKLARERGYRCEKKRKELEMEFSLLSGIFQEKIQETSSTPSDSPRPKTSKPK